MLPGTRDRADLGPQSRGLDRVVVPSGEAHDVDGVGQPLERVPLFVVLETMASPPAMQMRTEMFVVEVGQGPLPLRFRHIAAPTGADL